VHTWKNMIKHIKSNGGQVFIRARNYGNTLILLRCLGFDYRSFSPISSRYFKPLDMVKHLVYCIKIKSKFKPSVVFGFGIDAAIIAKICNVFSLIFTDSEPVGIQNTITRWLSSIILTPSCYRINLGKKQLKVPSYKELAYLHPNLFYPDSSVLKEIGVNEGEKYIILRCNAFDAVHDINRNGLTLVDKYGLLKELEPLTKIFISSETSLSDPLKQYELPTIVNRIHHILFFATLLITDTGTMATEAALLGTPTLLYLSNYYNFGNFNELEYKYSLVHCFNDPSLLSLKAIELIKLRNPNLDYLVNRNNLLQEKVNMNHILIKLLNEYGYLNNS